MEHTCWKLLIEGKRVPVGRRRLCQEMVGHGRDHRWRERGEQGEALFGLTGRFTASYQLPRPKRAHALSLDNGRLPPKPFEKETACFQPDFISAMFS